MSSPRPVVLSPATPSELLSYSIAYQRYPTTILVGWPKHVFVEALIQDVRQQQQQQQQQQQRTAISRDDDDNDGEASPPPPHPLQHPSLLQIAVSRHIRLVFIPTVAHLRAYLAAFPAIDSKIPAPPTYKPPCSSTSVSASDSANNTASTSASTMARKQPPLLLAYGFLELHRDGSEWSAQGLGTTAACLVETAARNAFRPAVVEPRGALDYEVLDQFLDENVPLLSGSSAVREDGSWSGRTVSIRRVLGRWFEFEAQGET